MNRRLFLTALAALPIVGRLVPKAEAAPIATTTQNVSAFPVSSFTVYASGIGVHRHIDGEWVGVLKIGLTNPLDQSGRNCLS